jgi:tryptophanyl-tRNA synthetase
VAGRYTRYGPLKADLAAAVVGILEPIQSRYRELAADEAYVASVLQAGAEQAGKVASATLRRAYDAVGLVPGRG